MAPAMRILVLQGGHGHYEGRHAFQHVGPGLSQVHALHARHDKAAMLVQAGAMCTSPVPARLTKSAGRTGTASRV
ncbi:hypothetical protein G6F31_021516 [Rhizopus arrhizus]|nr:hypothetical protein G6F31_021516 [Rhizopus arrhizus]